MQSTKSLDTSRLIGAVVITAILLIGIYVLILQNKPDAAATAAVNTASGTTAPTTTSSDDTTSGTSTTDSNSAATSTATSSAYKDGTYTATADYDVPREVNSIKVTLTVKDGTITAVDTQHTYADRESVRYINNFDSAVSGAVVGKALDTAQLNRLSGASDTAEGFDEALTTIISQAKA